MYVPDVFDESSDETAFALIGEIRLGSLISLGEPSPAGGIHVSHLPFMLDRGAGPRGRLIGHCAVRNPQWKTLSEGRQVLVTFLGPHTYVSPDWYVTRPRAPTWLYASVHVTGTATLVCESDDIRSMVMRLSHEMEEPSSGWSPEGVEPYIDKLLPGIIGFHIEIDGIQTQLRLAQQNRMDDRCRVHAALRSGTLSQRLVAQLMDRFSFREPNRT